LLLTLVFLAFFTLSCDKKEGFFGKGKVIAKVGGTEITGRDLVKYYKTLVQPSRHNSQPDSPAPLDLKMSLLGKLIEDKLLLREAAKEGIQVSDEEINQVYKGIAEDYGKDFNDYLKRLHLKLDEWKTYLSHDLLIEKVIRQHLRSVGEVTTREIKDYYQSHLKEFQVPVQYRFSQIVVPTVKMAQKVRGKLLKGGDFPELAKQYSISPEGKRGGDMGYWREDRLPKEFMIVREMKVGEISKVLRSPYGYHIIMLTGAKDAKVLSLKEAGPQIARKLISAKREAEKDRWLKELNKRANVIIYKDVLKKIKLN